MPEAGRAIMVFHFERLRKYAGPAAEGDVEAVHDMRVATRRLRAALRIAGPFYKRKVARSLRAMLKELADDLGAVRDRDVLIAHADRFDQEQPEGAPRLAAWLDHLRAQRADAHRSLIDYLRSKRFEKLLQTFEAFAGEAGADTKAAQPGEPSRVCDVVAVAVWQHYSIVRAYQAAESLSLAEMHALRIDVKRLRYTLEFFQQVLGRAAADLIALCVRLQDHLGELHDVDVASGLLRDFVAGRIQQGELGSSPALAAVFAYQTDVQSQIAERLRQFPDVWQPILDASFRRTLSRLLSRI